MALKRAKSIPTIDVNLVTIKLDEGTDEIALDTASKIAVATEIETVEAIKLVIKGVLKAQKGKQETITGNTITLTDNVFTPELVLALQGGEITYDSVDTDKIQSYTPPVAGSAPVVKTFTLSAYSAIYDAAGDITGYEKISYPNSKGSPIALSREDGAFSVAEYTIASAPKTGEAPYKIEYVSTLPAVTE